jgi:hypothetical protein
MKRIVLGIIVIVAVVITAVILAGDDRFDGPGAFSKNDKAVYLVKSRAETALIYETTADFIYSGNTKLSPTNDYIAVIETKRGVVPPGGIDYSILPENNLVIIDTFGNIICSTGDNARRYSWSPDGKKLAYIAGTYIEGGFGFRTTGVFLIDVPSCIKRKIVKDYPHPTADGDEGGGYDLNWAVHDSNLYVQEYPALGGNYSYDPKTGKTKQVAYKGIYFSPDGRYYFSLDPEVLQVDLYVTATNEDITSRVRQQIREIPAGWVPDRPHHLLSTIIEYDRKPEDTSGVHKARAFPAGKYPVKEKTFLLYDVEKDSVVKEWTEDK